MVTSKRVLQLVWAGILCTYAAAMLLSVLTGIAGRLADPDAIRFIAAGALFMGAVGVLAIVRPTWISWAPANGLLVFAVPLLFVPLGLRYSGPPPTAFIGETGNPFTSPSAESSWIPGSLSQLRSDALPQVVPRELTGDPDDPPISDLETVEFGEELFYRYHAFLYREQELFTGRRVVLRGFVGTEPAYPANRYYVARRLLWCCTADAVLLAFLVDAGRTSVPREGTWIELEATVDSTTFAGASQTETTVPLLRAERIREIEAPEFEYVLPF